MKNECSIIQDILPLYFENMVSEDTAAAVQEHLKNCPECAREFAAMKPDRKIDGISMEMRPGMEADALSAMRSLRRKFRKRLLRTTGIAVAALAVLTVLLHFFPIYRIAEIGPAGFYTAGESAKALYIGSPSDRAAAQAVLRMADEAFSDTRHTRVENEAAYGALARYATSTDSYSGVSLSYNEHSLELWSAHLDEDEGWIWVRYSSETFQPDGSIVCGSWRVPSLWRVEKDGSGEWGVVQIKERP